jgi:outer membrane protein OmpA-like peptidoglycan-associated protein
MKPQLVVMLVSIVVASPAWTQTSSTAQREEQIGVGSGMAVGGAAGGPIGVMVGAVVGALIGNKIHRERTGREEFERRFAQASQDIDSLESLLHGSERELDAVRAALNSQASGFREALREMLAQEIFFHTGEANLDQRTEERLAKLGDVIQLIDGVAIIIEGHADSRGDSDYNEQLSADRAAAVRNALIVAGVSAEQITARAVGERFATAAEDDLDSLALDRRVRLNVMYPENSNRVAQQ